MSRKYDEIKSFLKEQALKPESRTRMPTIVELMQQFGASQSPVSRAVHDLEQEGVLYCRRGMGIVSRSDRGRVTVRPKKEGVARGNIAFFSVDYFASTIWEKEHTLNAYANQLGYTMNNYRIQRNSDRVAMIKESMGLDNLSGIVLMSSADRLEMKVFELLSEISCPAVILDSYFSYDNLPSNVSVLMPDALYNGKSYMEFFHAKGHRNIGFVRSLPDGTISQLMITGASEAAAELDMELTIFSAAIKSWEDGCDAGRNITRSNITSIREKGITGLIYIGQSSTVAGRRILWENDIRVPEDISLISHGNDVSLSDCIPAITASKTDFTAMSCDALDIISGKLPQQPMKLYPATIIERESVLEKLTL